MRSFYVATGFDRSGFRLRTSSTWEMMAANSGKLQESSMAHRPPRRGTGQAAYPSALLTNSTARYWDFTTKNIFAGDDAGGMNYWRDTGSTAGSCSAPCFGSRVTTNFSSITDPPVLDGSTGKVNSHSPLFLSSIAVKSRGNHTSGTDTVRPSSGTTFKASLEHERSTAIAYPRVPIARKSSIMGECENSDFVRELQIHNMKWESSDGCSTGG